jgi:hypothetical protein
MENCKGNHMLVCHHGSTEGIDLETFSLDSLETTSSGNSWYFGCDALEIRNVITHSKNDRRPNNSTIEYEFPDGPLKRLLLSHIMQGQALLTEASGDSMPFLFVTRKGREFSDSTFVQFWSSLMEGTSNIKYFCPSLGRTVFVEAYCAEEGVPPDMWDGASICMGTSVAQWAQSYNPSRKKRLAQRAVDGHAAFMSAKLMQQQLRQQQQQQSQPQNQNQQEQPQNQLQQEQSMPLQAAKAAAGWPKAQASGQQQVGLQVEDEESESEQQQEVFKHTKQQAAMLDMLETAEEMVDLTELTEMSIDESLSL